jgi:hypothetical protein
VRWLLRVCNVKCKKRFNDFLNNVIVSVWRKSPTVFEPNTCMTGSNEVESPNVGVATY